jgi:hypothetical protein
VKVPFDRRRRGLLRYLLAPLPWKSQGRIGNLAFDHPDFWWLVAALSLLAWKGPWPVAVAALLYQTRKAWHAICRRVRPRWESPPTEERTLWSVRVAENWRWWLLRKTGILVLPRRALLGAGDIFLIDIRNTGDPSPLTYYLGARFGGPLVGRSKRRWRRIVKVAALWTLEERPTWLGTEPSPIHALDPIEEEPFKWGRQLQAKVGVFEARKPTWREERGAHDLFHKLWGMHHDGAPYHKPTWGELQGKLRGVGMWV